MSRWINQLRAVWQRIFFWQKLSGPSAAMQPETHDDHALVLAVSGSAKTSLFKRLWFLPRVLPATEWRIFWIAGLIFIAGILVGTIDLARFKIVQVPAHGGVATVALVGSPKLINPLYASLNDVDRDIATLVYSSLFRLNDHLEPIPDLAESYQWSDDGKTLEVTLRRDVKFQDEIPLTADDVAFTYNAIQNPAYRSPLARVFRSVHVVLVDDKTIQFQLDEPNPTFLNDLTIGILPAHIWSNIPEASAQLADVNIRPIGSGPYKVVSFTRDSKGLVMNFRLEQFDQYYGLKPYIHEWRFRFYADRPSAEAAFKNGLVDALAFAPWAEAEQTKNDNSHPIRIELPQKTIAFFNTKDPLLKDIDVRKALTLAIDSSEIANVLGSEVRITDSPFPFDVATTGTPANLDESRKLLDSLGWKLNEPDGLRYAKATSTDENASGTVLSLMITVPNQPDLVKVAELLQRRWSLVGVKVDVHSDDAQPLLEDALSHRTYQVLIWNVLLSPEQDLNAFWNSSQTKNGGFNFSNIEDRDLDAALNKTTAATTTEMLAAARTELAQTITERYPALFLFEPSYSYLLSKRIQGASDLRIGTPSDRLWQAMSWYVNTHWAWK